MSRYKCHDNLPWQNFVTKIFSKSPKCHRTKCHDILPWHNYVTKIFVMPFYPDIIMAPKIWLSPRNVTLENVTTYFVRQMNRPIECSKSVVIVHFISIRSQENFYWQLVDVVCIAAKSIPDYLLCSNVTSVYVTAYAPVFLYQINTHKYENTNLSNGWIHF